MRRKSAIGLAFATARRAKRAAFVPFVMAGDPDLPTTVQIVRALARAGADVVELGVPFSDPIADGPENQAAATRALAAGTTLELVLATVAELRAATAVPLVLFSYFNPILRYGIDRFAEHAAASGVDGVLVVDLPPEEAAGEYLDALRAREIDRIFLLAPTSTAVRRRAVRRAGSGFVYYVSRTGVTGERDALPRELTREVDAVRRAVDLPVAVGFGISTPEQAASVARIADGVVVGSALVRRIAAEGDAARLAPAVEEFAGALVAATRRRGGR
jgi:tryptophan synthase alpha chain